MKKHTQDFNSPEFYSTEFQNQNYELMSHKKNSFTVLNSSNDI